MMELALIINIIGCTIGLIIGYLLYSKGYKELAYYIKNGVYTYIVFYGLLVAIIGIAPKI